MPKSLFRTLWIFIAFISLTSAVACKTAPEEDAVVAAVLATLEAQNATVSTAPTAEPEIRPIRSNLTGDLQQTLVDLYSRVNPSVVSIIVSQGGLGLSTGSGFVYDNQGHIVTNAHVVADGDQYEVAFANGDHRRGDIIGQDVDSDLAIIWVTDLPADALPLPLGDVDDIQVGQFVVAIGNPFGEQGSMSLGIVSALGRSLSSQRTSNLGGSYRLPRVIQTDAPINPGNSGGPLLDLQGGVIGINSAIRTDTGVNSGVGFSIPVDAIKRIAPSLIQDGSYRYPFMGITVLSPGDLGLDFQASLNLPQATGVYVTQVVADGPADQAGIVPSNGTRPGGDLIVKIDGREMRSFDDLNSYLVFEAMVDQTIQVTLLRGDQELTLPVTLGARP